MTDATETLPPADEGRLERRVGRPVPTRYYLRYLCANYTLADAFRPQPGWGSKGYFVEAEPLGEHTDEDVIRAAQDTAPPGYWLQHIEAIGGEPRRRDVFKKAVPTRHVSVDCGECPRISTGCPAGKCLKTPNVGGEAHAPEQD